VRRVVDRVHPGEGAGLVRQLGDPGDVDERADRVRGPGERDHARALGELRSEVVEVERGVVADVGEADAQIEIPRQLEPGRDVAVVVQPGHEDLVAGRELPGRSPREREVERRHVGAEDDFLSAAAEEASRSPAGLIDQQVGAAARLEGAADVRVRLAQVAGDRVHDLVRHLRAPGAVEEGELAVECREAPPDRGRV